MNELKSIEDNFFAVGRYWGKLNYSLVQTRSIVAMNTGVPISNFNWVWNENPLTTKDTKSIEEVKEIYKKIGLRFRWWVYPRGNSTQTIDVLQNAGMRLATQTPCMAADLNIETLDRKIPEYITISEVADRNSLLVWEDISFRGFQIPERAREQYTTFVLSFELRNQSPQKLFLACMEGKPVATSLLFVDDKAAGIYYVSTLPAYRNKGLGFYVTVAAMQAAKKEGFKNVILQATPAGAKVYRRIGFKEYCRAQIYKL